MVAQYRQRISGPLLDRFDLQVAVAAVPHREMVRGQRGEPSAVVAERVGAARGRQAARLGSLRAGQIGGGAMNHAQWAGASLTNAGLTPSESLRIARPDEAGCRLLERAIGLLGLSARAHDSVLRVARTIADLEGSDGVAARHVAEAVQYRLLDRPAVEKDG